MSEQTDEVHAAATELVHAMARLVRAIDAVGDDGAAAAAVSEDVPTQLEALAARLSAAGGFPA
jgi:hypothetical protein